MFLNRKTTTSIKDYSDKIRRVKELWQEADAVIIGAGAGLSTSAGFTYSGERFRKYFSDFIDKYHFDNMYEGGFYPFESLEEYWAYWSRYITINRYTDVPKPVYEHLFELVKGKDYFVLTTNLGIGLAKQGKKVLVIDADAQGSLTASLGFTEPDKLEVSLANVLEKVINDEETEEGYGILKHEEGIDLMPGQPVIHIPTMRRR